MDTKAQLFVEIMRLSLSTEKNSEEENKIGLLISPFVTSKFQNSIIS